MLDERVDPETVRFIGLHCHGTYRVRAGAANAFVGGLARVWAALERHALVSKELHTFHVTDDESGKKVFYHRFVWASEHAEEHSLSVPEVMECWGALLPLTEERLELPAVEFTHTNPLPFPPS